MLLTLYLVYVGVVLSGIVYQEVNELITVYYFTKEKQAIEMIKLKK